jgi:5-methylthioadenosine/S-adenosylhomocysteine deaminase
MPNKNTSHAGIETADLMISGGMVLTMAGGREPIEEATLLVKGHTITSIEKSPAETRRGEETQIIDANQCLVMPGLINAHTHSAMTLFRGFADDLPLKQWLFEKIFPLEAKVLNSETVYWASLLACLEMIACGTTCFVDGYFFQEATFRAACDAGLRGLLAQGVIDHPAPGVRDPKENLAVGRKFIEECLHVSDLHRPGLFCHSPVTCSEKTLREAKAISQSYHLPLQIHLSETQDETEEVLRNTGRTPVDYLNRIGLLDEDLIAAHAVHLDDKEIKTLERSGAKVVHVPESNMKLASGVADVKAMIHTGLIPGLGTDGPASNNNLDLFQEMDAAAKLSKVFHLDPTALNAENALKMATLWGAAVLGLENDIGTLEVGKKADIIILELNSPHMTPLYNPHSALVYSADGGDVRDVIVNGKVLMRNREFKTLDFDKITYRVKQIARNIAG